LGCCTVERGPTEIIVVRESKNQSKLFSVPLKGGRFVFRTWGLLLLDFIVKRWFFPKRNLGDLLLLCPNEEILEQMQNPL
jgi:hypothetical protein